MTPPHPAFVALLFFGLLCPSCDSSQPTASDSTWESSGQPPVVEAHIGQKRLAPPTAPPQPPTAAPALKADPLPMAAPPAPEDDEPHRHDWMRKEHVGTLAVGMPADKVIALLGPPTSKGKREFSEATGFYAEQWSWPKKGVVLSMDAPGEQGEPTEVGHLKLSAPFAGKTARDVGMGSSREDVIAAYKDVAGDHSDLEDQSRFVVGDVFHAALAFRFNKRGKVDLMEMGHMAE